MVFVKLSLDELAPGSLRHAFTNGNVAAIVECGEFVKMLWSMLLHDPEETLPWELPLLDIARNHLRGKDLPSTLGDVFYFQPGHHSYIARKLEVERMSDLNVLPAKFNQGEKQVSANREMVKLCCSFVDKVMLSLSLPGCPLPQYNVAIQRLKYQSEWEEFQSLVDLIEDSLGRWARKGYVLDALRSQLAAPLARKGISDVLALLKMVTGARAKGRSTQQSLRVREEPVSSATHIYEHAHVDFRYFTALCGCRQNVRTEVLANGDWLELPVSLDAIAIYPGTIGLRDVSAAPTIHRVVHTESSQSSSDRASNVTVLLGAT